MLALREKKSWKFRLKLSEKPWRMHSAIDFSTTQVVLLVLPYMMTVLRLRTLVICQRNWQLKPSNNRIIPSLRTQLLPTCSSKQRSWRIGVVASAVSWMLVERLTFPSLSTIRMHLLFGWHSNEMPYNHTTTQVHHTTIQPHKVTIQPLCSHLRLNVYRSFCQ